MRKLKYISIISILSIIGCTNSQELKVPNSSTNLDISTPAQLDIRNKMVSYINSIRVKGTTCAPPAPPLQYNSYLQSAAMAHTKDMAINRFFRHNGSGTELDAAKPELAPNSTFVDRITYFGYPVKPNLLVGENITYTKFSNTKSKKVMPNFKKAVSNWIKDKEHCGILMNPRFKYAGIAYQITKDRYYFTLNLAEDSNK